MIKCFAFDVQRVYLSVNLFFVMANFQVDIRPAFNRPIQKPLPESLEPLVEDFKANNNKKIVITHESGRTDEWNGVINFTKGRARKIHEEPLPPETVEAILCEMVGRCPNPI